jgi:hypothetical protein
MYICITNKQIVENMEIQIKQTDAFRELCKITLSNEKHFEEKILKGLDSIDFLMDWTQEAGRTIGEIIDEHGEHTIEEVVNAVFPSGMFGSNEEVKQFMSGILLWGTAIQHACEQCGCECDVEHDGTDGISWKNVDCTNPECDWSDSREPDWDGLPGGYDHKNDR